LTILSPEGADGKLGKLRDLMREQQLEADVICFWHAKRGVPRPAIPNDIRATLALLPASIETDFDTERTLSHDSSRRRQVPPAQRRHWGNKAAYSGDGFQRTGIAAEVKACPLGATGTPAGLPYAAPGAGMPSSGKGMLPPAT
jgi:hypothetical protein